MGGGLAAAVIALANQQHAQQAEVCVVFTERPDTPCQDQLQASAPGIGLERHVPRQGIVTVGFLRAVWCALRDPAVQVVHAHSSWAGLVVRGMAALCGAQAKTFYSPHGFAWLRQDVSPTVRAALLWVERACSLIGTQILVSPSEADLSKRRLLGRRTLLQNCVEIDELPARVRATGERPLVAMCGRVTYQKAPWRFNAAAEALSDVADFVWIGDGDAEDKALWLGHDKIRVTGWLGRPDLVRELARADILYFPTLWEGMPLALMESQAMGIPAVATPVIGNVDVVVDGRTGYLATDEADLLAALSNLVRDRSRVTEFSANAMREARTQFAPSSRAERVLSVYDAGSRADAPSAPGRSGRRRGWGLRPAVQRTVVGLWPGLHR